MIKKQFKALVTVCMSSANVLKRLAPAMRHEARGYLRPRMGNANVAEIYLKQFEGQADGERRLHEDMEAIYGKAAPEVTTAEPAGEMNLLAVPPGASQQDLRELVVEASQGKTWLTVDSADEIVLYREHTLGLLADLDQLGPEGQEAYQKLVAKEHFTPHCRGDITEWGTRTSEPAPG